MKKGYNELSYAYAVGRLRVLETKLLSRSDYDKLLGSENLTEALKILSDFGWGSFENYQDMIDDQIFKNFALIETLGGGEFLKTQRVKYDYHNIKVLLKAELAKENADHLLIDCGNISLKKIKESLLSRDYKNLSENMRKGIKEALEQYARIPDPSLLDIILDNRGFKDIVDYANEQPDKFVLDMIKTQIDLQNIKTYIRVRKMDKDFAFMSKVITVSGTIPVSFFIKHATEPYDKTASVFEKTAYADVFSKGGNIQKQLDEIFIKQANSSRMQAFGIPPLAGYFWAKENEILNVRIILTCIASGISAEVIRQRLRGV